MVANMLSFFISRRYQPVPIYHALLHQDGVHLPSPATQLAGTGRTARHVMRTDVSFISPEASVEEAWRAMAAHDAAAYLVGTRDHLEGLVTRAQLEEWRASPRAADRLGSLITDSFVHAHPDHSIDVVLDRLSASGGVLPVVSRKHARRVEGVVTRDTVLMPATDPQGSHG
jgi:CBS domain-containing protein